jgi:hypothetical protein
LRLSVASSAGQISNNKPLSLVIRRVWSWG